AKDSALEVPQDTPANRRKGWQRICLFGFYFRPSALDVEKTGKLLREALNAPDRSRRNFFGLYPFRWQPSWPLAFETLRGKGRLLVAPVLQTLIFPRGPKEVIAWADWVAAWQFERIIPCHMDAPIAAGPKEFRQAFTFLESRPSEEAFANGRYALPQEDFQLLRQLESVLVKRKLTPPAQEKV
ncbi:MAG: DUF4336 domain-containing protein, partial [Cyanobacteria bacterium Co-bin13]|nr:DUF4336 domain-containing protein [Cyanobacteria bacterium Co-bin13]